MTSGKAPFPSAGYEETKTDYIASEAKVAVMYSAYILRDMVERFAKATGATKADVLFSQLDSQMKQSIAAAVARIASATNISDEQRLPHYPAVLLVSATPGTTGRLVNFTPTYDKALEEMIVPSNNNSARDCIHGIGYSYLNGALAAGGFFDSSDHGLWVAGDYQSENEWPYVRIPCDNDIPTAYAGTTRHMVRLVSLIATKGVLDAPSCDEMLGRLKRAANGTNPDGSIRGVRDQSWVERAGILKAGCITHNKIGLGNLGPIGKNGPEVRSEVIVLSSPVASGRTYVVAWQNLVDPSQISFADIATLIKDTITDFEK